MRRIHCKVCLCVCVCVLHDPLLGKGGWPHDVAHTSLTHIEGGVIALLQTVHKFVCVCSLNKSLYYKRFKWRNSIAFALV